MRVVNNNDNKASTKIMEIVERMRIIVTTRILRTNVLKAITVSGMEFH